MENIIFEPFCTDGSIHWSDLIVDGKCIAAYAEKETSILNPVKEWFQINVPEKYKECGDYYYTSEDKGNVMVCFNGLESLERVIEFCKNI